MLRINVLGGLFVTGEGRPLSGAAAQPRRLALLALLGVAGERGVTRDALLSYLWPDNDEDRARRALTQALYALRRDLGSDECFLGLKDLRINPDLVTVDLLEFHDAIGTGNLDRAAELYRGPFLEGFHLPGADTFERWVEDERSALAHEQADLLHQLGTRAIERGEFRAAVGWFRKRAGGDPLNAQTALALMDALARSGDVAGALQHARVYETLVRQELDLPPDREVVALAARLREGHAPPTGGLTATPAPGAASPPPPPLPPAPASALMLEESGVDGHTSGWATMPPAGAAASSRPAPPHAARWMVRGAAALLLLLLGAALVRFWPRPKVAAPERVVAVGRIAHYEGGHPGGLGQPLGDMLATNLARIEGLRVVSNARMVEVMRQAGGGTDTAASTVAAARQTGATELVDGSLYNVGAGQYRLDLRRVDLATGAVLHAYTVQGADLFALADSGTARLAGDVGGARPTGSLADVTTRSLDAYAFYSQGLRRYFAGDLPGAAGLFDQALTADSTFAMAAFYRGLSVTGTRAEQFQALARAVRLADGASDRERLLIRATWAFLNSSPSLLAIADTLRVRYPAELEGYLLSGQAAISAGNYAAAHAALAEVIARDSLGLGGKAVRCLACEALGAQIGAYTEEDSLPHALLVARQWTRLQPASPTAWRALAMLHGAVGAIDSAQAALQRADSLAPTFAEAWIYHVSLALWADRLPEAEELARAQLKAGPPSQRAEAIWNLCIVLRHQGRIREALTLARQYREARSEAVNRDAAPLSSYLYGQVLFESGEYRASAALFDSLSHVRIPTQDASGEARNRVWSLTHKATALAALGDTARLSALADTLERLGQESSLARDRRLHFYTRGFIARARGHHEEAAGAFRSSIVSAVGGFTRANYALAGELMLLGRPAEAIPMLESALRGIYEGSALYLTHTELEERLAQAYEAAGNRQRAALLYQRVARNWEPADPAFTPRRLEAAGKAIQLLSHP